MRANVLIVATTLAVVAIVGITGSALAGIPVPPLTVPEPASLALLAAGAAGVLLLRRRK